MKNHLSIDIGIINVEFYGKNKHFKYIILVFSADIFFKKPTASLMYNQTQY